MATSTETYQIYLEGWLAMKYPRENAEELAARYTASDIWHEKDGNPVDCNTKDCDCESSWRNFLPRM